MSAASGNQIRLERSNMEAPEVRRGSLTGEPVIVMHGGPGAGSHSSSARFFNPQRYRVVLFDQRGCGKSTPSASDDDSTPALTDNTTRHLIDDVSALRQELNINGKMHVFGGSWGSTLALAYAIAHPATVQTLILRGVFLCRRADVDYFFQGNAAEFVADPLAMPAPGAYLNFPTAWRHFVDVIPPEDRGDVVKGLAKAFCAPPRLTQNGSAWCRAPQPASPGKAVPAR